MRNNGRYRYGVESCNRPYLRTADKVKYEADTVIDHVDIGDYNIVDIAQVAIDRDNPHKKGRLSISRAPGLLSSNKQDILTDDIKNIRNMGFNDII